MTKLLFLPLLILFTVFTSVSAPTDPKIKSIGFPPMTTYAPGDYNFDVQNFDVLIGDDQKVYFANNAGILVYDGIHWTQLALPRASPVYSLDKGEDGTIYVGGVNELGYLNSKANGELEYISLIERFGLEDAESFISLALSFGDQIFFSTLSKNILFNPQTGEANIFDSPAVFYTVHENNGNLYSYANDSLFHLKENEWVPLKHSIVHDYIAYGKNHLVSISDHQTIVISQNGFFDFETEEKIKIDNDVETLLQESNIYDVNLLLNKYIAICTWEGLVITDLKGNLIQFLTKDKGLPDNFIFVSALDNSSMLWVATNNGIVKIDLFSPFSILDKRTGIDGTVNDSKLIDDQIYLTSFSGVFTEKWSNLGNPEITPAFKKINSTISHGMIKTAEGIIVLTEFDPNFAIENGSLQKISGTEYEIFWTGTSYKDSHDVLLGSSLGNLIHISKMHGKWVVKKKMDLNLLAARPIATAEGMDIWVTSLNEGVSKVKYNKEQLSLISEQKYGEKDGLPSDLNNYIRNIEMQPIFATSMGIYRYESDSDRFVIDSRFKDLIGEVPVSLIVDDTTGNIYYFDEEFNMLKKTATGYDKRTFHNIDFFKYPAYGITAVNEKNVIIGSANAILHFDPTSHQEQIDFNINLTKISSLKTDSVFYGGFGVQPPLLLFEADDNAIRFEFSSAFYQSPEKTMNRWRLSSESAEWSEWSLERKKDYTNLPNGEYKFEVMAKNVNGIETKPKSISFIIKTPWYLTVWAYFGYGIGFMIIMLGAFKLNTRRLQHDKKKLEQIVVERTAKINLQKEKAEQDAQTISVQNDKLVEMDELKARFFLNISHELRTPLTLTMGTVDQALKGRYGSLSDELYAHLKSSFRNSQRLLKMVNNILNVSKLEGGKMQLHTTKTNPSKILSKVTDFFASKFYDKNIELRNDVNSDSELFIDKDKFESIFINLIANAFKHTNEGGLIRIYLVEDNEQMTFKVKDNGIGIPSTDLPAVFDRFYQSSHGTSDGGTGLGLTLTKELIQLHKGKISVQSELNSGSEFIVSFLKGSKHLSHDQIVPRESKTEFEVLDDKYPLTDDLKKKNQTINNRKESALDKERPHILLVEDNSEMSQFIRELLSDKYSVSIAEHGQEALDFLKDQMPDLILTDYLMPIMDGYEMANEIKKSDEWTFIPIIFLTARTEEQDKIDVLNLGVDDYLFKPFSNDELQVRIKNLLHTKKQRIEFLSEKRIDPRDIEWKEFPSKLKLNIDDYIKAHIKEEITGEDLSVFTSQSERSLYRKVKVNTGLSLMQYIKEFRLRKARTLLEQKEVQTVSEVAYSVGFNYLSHFTKNYKERFGKSPSEYLD